MQRREPAHDVAVGKSCDKKTGPRPLRGFPAVNDVIKGSRCPGRYVLHVKPISQFCDSTTIRRCHDAFDYDESYRNYDMRSIRLRYGYIYDYDTTTTKNRHVHFFARVELRRMEAGARDTS